MTEHTDISRLGSAAAGSSAAPKAPPAPAQPKAKPRSAKKRRAPAAPKAPYGWDVVGEDGRRIARSLPRSEAQAEAHRITSITGETLEVVAAELASPAVAIPETEPTE